MEFLNPICEKCGKEIEAGLLNYVRHNQECERNAPNESIELYRKNLEIKESTLESVRSFNKTFKKMSKEEKLELYCLSMCGIIEEQTILMGKKAFDNYNNYKEKMIEKYGTDFKMVMRKIYFQGEKPEFPLFQE